MNIWAAILLGVICFWLGHREGKDKPFFYIGYDEEKYKKSLFGILRSK